MDTTALLAHLADDGPRLITAAARAGWDTPVPGLEWTARELVVHIGGVQRWSTAIVRGASRDETRTARAEQPGADLETWFVDGHEQLVAALEAAPEDLDVWTFAPARTPRAFWIRRQAHELAVHRADAELAAGEEPDFADDLAQDGIAELLQLAGSPRFAVDEPGAIGLDAGDGPSWWIDLAEGGNHGRPSEDLTGTDVTVRGRSAELYLWVWNRRSAAVCDGDERVAERWARHVRL